MMAHMNHGPVMTPDAATPAIATNTMNLCTLSPQMFGKDRNTNPKEN